MKLLAVVFLALALAPVAAASRSESRKEGGSA